MNSGETMSLPDFDAIAGRQTVAEFVNEYGRAEKDIRTGQVSETHTSKKENSWIQVTWLQSTK